MKNRLQTLIKSLVSGLLVVSITPAWAVTGSEGVGGGERALLNGKYRLRDLVDLQSCRWLSGPEFQKKYAPGFTKFMEKLKHVHWYFAWVLQREIDGAHFCRTENLKPVPTDDEDSFTIFKKDKVQLAIRAEELVFVDMPGLESLEGAGDKDFLFLHEMMHSFLPFGRPRRNDALRSSVAMLWDAVDKTSLEESIAANHLDLPGRIEELDSFREILEKALDRKTPLVDVYSSALELKKAGLVEKLWDGDKQKLRTAIDIYKSDRGLLRAILIERRFDELVKFYGVHDINESFDDAETGLHMAAFQSYVEAVEWMLNQPGVDAGSLNLRGLNAAEAVRRAKNTRGIVHADTSKILKLLDEAEIKTGTLRKCRVTLYAYVPPHRSDLGELSNRKFREWNFQVVDWQSCYRKAMATMLSYPNEEIQGSVTRYIDWRYDDSKPLTFDSSGQINHQSPKNQPEKGDQRLNKDGSRLI
jgi:hypothetical protein